MKRTKRNELVQIIAITLMFLMVVGIILASMFFGVQQKIYYEDKLRPVVDVEEIISDKLEVENPTLDIDVNITTETDD